MIPILYTADEYQFVSEGVGRLNCVSCYVTEEPNSIPECEFSIPITEEIFPLIKHGMIIYTTHDETKTPQPYEIYAHSAPIDDVVTFYARHIATRQNNIIVAPFTANNVVSALEGIKTNSINPNPFTYWTDRTTQANFSCKKPSTAQELLGGTAGSILDTFGHGEYEFDKFNVKFYAHRGQDTDVEIRYGSNLVDFEQEKDSSGTYNVVMPYWCDSDGDVAVELPERFVYGSGAILNTAYLTADTGENITDEYGDPIEVAYVAYIYAPLDMTEKFDERPTVEQLRTAASAYLERNKPWIASDTIDIDFVALWQTEEYKSIAPLQRIKLWDTVTVIYPDLGYAERVPVVKTVYDSLLERYDSMQLGQSSATFETIIREEIPDLPTDYVDEGMLNRAINNATDQLTGNLGGSHVILHQNADGGIDEIYIMDTDDVDTAMNVWRFNSAGWGHSSTGINGLYTLAATQDGAIVADMITSGVLNANLIKAGTLNGDYITVINLTATNVDLTGVFKNVSDAYDIYVKTTGGGWAVFKKSDDTILGTFGAAMTNDTINGGAIVLNNASGQRVAGLGATASGTGALIIYDSSNNFVVQAYRGANDGSGYLRTYYSGEDVATTLGDGHLLLRNNGNVTVVDVGLATSDNGGLWLYDDSGTNRTSLGVESLFFFGSTGSAVAKIGEDSLGMLNGSSWIASMDRYGLIYGSSLSITGSKNRVVETQDYGTKKLYSYETASPMFGDVGEGETDETGVCFVWLDPVFSETINTAQYQVFLQAYGNGTVYVAKREKSHFIVHGSAHLAFGWEIKAKQVDFVNERLERFDKQERKESVKIDYASEANKHIKSIYLERGIKINDENGIEPNAVPRFDRSKDVRDVFGNK